MSYKASVTTANVEAEKRRRRRVCNFLAHEMCSAPLNFVDAIQGSICVQSIKEGKGDSTVGK